MAVDHDLRGAVAGFERRLASVSRELPGHEIDALAAAQSRADSVMAMLGDRASPPMVGEDSFQYRKRMLRHLAPHSPRFKDSRFGYLDAATLPVIEEGVYSDAQVAAQDPSKHPPGKLIPIQERDVSGRVITRFVGDIGAMLAPFVDSGRTVTIIRK